MGGEALFRHGLDVVLKFPGWSGGWMGGGSVPCDGEHRNCKIIRDIKQSITEFLRPKSKYSQPHPFPMSFYNQTQTA